MHDDRTRAHRGGMAPASARHPVSPDLPEPGGVDHGDVASGDQRRPATGGDRRPRRREQDRACRALRRRLPADDPQTPSAWFFEQRYGWARAYRDGRLVAGRVRLIIDHDVRVGLASRERRRRSLRAAFTEGVDPALRAELVAVSRRRDPANASSARRSCVPSASSKTQRSRTASSCARSIRNSAEDVRKWRIA